MVKKKSVRSKTKEIVIPSVHEINQPPQDLNAYTILLMGAKGIGKTTASSSFPGNLNMQWEPRRKNVPLRMIGSDQGLLFKSAQEILDGSDDPWFTFVEYNLAAIEDDTVENITWDTVDIAYNACFESICARKGITHPSEIKKDYGQTWNEVKAEFSALMDTVRGSEKCGLLLISHVKEREVEFSEGTSGKVNLLGPSCTPACLQLLKSACDYWFYYGYDEGKRTLWVRDEDRLVDVACGVNFIEPDGELIYKFRIPEPATDRFYEVVESAFHGNVIDVDEKSIRSSKKKVVKKKTTKKKVSKKKIPRK